MTTQELVERLRGTYRIPITDGLGPAGGEEPGNADFFVRVFPTSLLAKKAANRLSEMDAEIKRLEKERAYAVRWGEGAVESVKEVMWRYEDALKQIEGGHVPGMADLALAHDLHAVVNLFQARARAALEQQP